ncbi:hypothetical protein F53441_11213 [Fusarium austroafricanum]|uniref:C2H2-type domain-containing protein n=1 Tax=Fusarium austroafricanum TaxID=2364996 RepID=A0A8H4K5L9_9HYPO|nr:hypothetical protein F53441_11213 [Fusarium austroafricanum]
MGPFPNPIRPHEEDTGSGFLQELDNASYDRAAFRLPSSSDMRSHSLTPSIEQWLAESDPLQESLHFRNNPTFGHSLCGGSLSYRLPLIFAEPSQPSPGSAASSTSFLSMDPLKAHDPTSPVFCDAALLVGCGQIFYSNSDTNHHSKTRVANVADEVVGMSPPESAPDTLKRGPDPEAERSKSTENQNLRLRDSHMNQASLPLRSVPKEAVKQETIPKVRNADYIEESGVNAATTSPSSTPTASSHLELLSISSDSEWEDAPGINTQGFKIFSQVFCRLTCFAQEAVSEGKSGESGSKGKQPAKSDDGSSSNSVGGSTQSRKHRRYDDGGDDGTGDKGNEPPSKKGKGRRSECQARPKFLACPFWKLDPDKYWECFLKKNDTIAHLKQHLTRRHTPEYYCQICYKKFKDYNLYDSHALERSCTRDPSAKLEGISQQQKNSLSVKSKGSIESQWYAVWSILFPDIEAPTTIYIHSTQSEDFCRIQQFAQREGVAILLDELSNSGLVVRTSASDEDLRSTIRRAMASIFRNYSLRRLPTADDSEMAPVSAEQSQIIVGVPPQVEASAEPGTNSGIALGNSISADVTQLQSRLGMEDIIDHYRPNITQFPMTSTFLPRSLLEANHGLVQEGHEGSASAPAFSDALNLEQSLSSHVTGFNFDLGVYHGPEAVDWDALLQDVINE